MNYKELAEKAREIKADGERFLAQYENEIVDFLREDAEDAESRLQKEIFFEFLDNLHGMCHLAEYMGLEVVKGGSGSGQPGRDDAGRRYPAADDRSRGEAV
ncbi:MAG: hypothetical protein ACLU8D_05895 [Enterocloster sp.]